MNKQLLANISEHVLPFEIMNRSKMGFVLPFEKWLRKNINKLDVNVNVKNNFYNNKITCSRFWATLVLDRFDGRL